MVELRHALRAYALEGHPTVGDPRLPRAHAARSTTRSSSPPCACCSSTSSATSCTVANAGHLRPLILENGKSSYLEVDGPMLGLRRPHPPDVVHELAASWSLVLITDGLVEDPQVDLDVALEDLRSTVMDELDPDRLCERLLERFGRPRFDDIALLVLRGTPHP